MKKAVLRELLKKRETYKATVFEADKVGVELTPSKPKKKSIFKKGDK